MAYTAPSKPGISGQHPLATPAEKTAATGPALPDARNCRGSLDFHDLTL